VMYYIYEHLPTSAASQASRADPRAAISTLAARLVFEAFWHDVAPHFSCFFLVRRLETDLNSKITKAHLSPLLRF
jgi:hypothetical protein